jgi:hypothetical protein
MSKETDAILKAYHIGEKDKKDGFPCKNLFSKQKYPLKWKAYMNGYNDVCKSK